MVEIKYPQWQPGVAIEFEMQSNEENSRIEIAPRR